MVITNLFPQKSSGPDGVTGEFFQTAQEVLILIFFRPFEKVEETETLSSSLYEGTLIETKGRQRHDIKRKL